MASFTSRLNLRKPTTGEKVDVETDIGASMEKIDANLGAFVCTSGTRPSSPWVGQIIFETDTKSMRTWDGTKWLGEAYGSWRGTGGSGSSYSVAHSLGAVPAVILLQWTGPVNVNDYTLRVTSRSATDFVVAVYYNGVVNNGPIPADRGFDWVARI